jgi:hypothetical protein
VEHQTLDDVDRPGRRLKPALELCRHPLFFVVRPRLEQLVRVLVMLDDLVRAGGNAMEEAEVDRLEHPPFGRPELVQEPLFAELA